MENMLTFFLCAFACLHPPTLPDLPLKLYKQLKFRSLWSISVFTTHNIQWSPKQSNNSPSNLKTFQKRSQIINFAPSADITETENYFTHIVVEKEKKKSIVCSMQQPEWVLKVKANYMIMYLQRNCNFTLRAFFPLHLILNTYWHNQMKWKRTTYSLVGYI